MQFKIGHLIWNGRSNKNFGSLKYNLVSFWFQQGRGSVPGFYQPAHSVRQLQTTVTVDRVSLMQSDAANLISDAMVNDRVELRIMGDVRAKIRIIGLTSPGVQVSDSSNISFSLCAFVKKFIFHLPLAIIYCLWIFFWFCYKQNVRLKRLIYQKWCLICNFLLQNLATNWFNGLA